MKKLSSKEIKENYYKLKMACFFSKENTRFFNSRTHGGGIEIEGNIYFITSEKFGEEKREYTIRKMFGNNGEIVNYSQLGQYKTIKEARKALNNIKGE